jgi:hypothetical protein
VTSSLEPKEGKQSFELRCVSEYQPGRPGLWEVTADSLTSLREGIDELLRRYPKNPYGTRIIGGNLKNDGKTWSAQVEHWSSD